MSRRLSIAALLVAALSLSACQTTGQSGYGQKQGMGAVLGGIGGGVAGAQFGKGSGKTAATIAGVLLGAAVGASIGRDLDEVDRMRLEQASYQALEAPLNTQIVWDNPNTGNSGSIIATREGRNRSTGSYCREYQQTITVGGRQEQAYGTACQQPDGSWKIQG